MSSLFDRHDFPMLKRLIHGKPLVYLDSAATTLKPQSVIDAIAHFYASEYGTVHRAVYTLAGEATARYNAVREQVQRFLHAVSPDEIIFTRGTTDAINLTAFSFGEAFVRSGDEILVSAMEHHSNIVPWQLLCERKGAYLKIIPLTVTGELDLEAYERLLSPRTRLVSVAHISNVLGVVNPLGHIIDLAHQEGAKVFVDGAQSAPHLPVDVQALDCDFFAFSGHKIYGPTGIGILYGKRELLEEMPPYQGGGDMIQTVGFEKTKFQPPPLRFEAGTPMIAEVIGLGTALEYVEKYGMANIAAYESTLLQQAMEQLQSLDAVTIYGPLDRRGALVTFSLGGVHPLDAATFLDLQGIALRSGSLCAQPLLQYFGCASALRLSLAPYNTVEDISYFGKVLRSLQSTLTSTR